MYKLSVVKDRQHLFGATSISKTQLQWARGGQEALQSDATRQGYCSAGSYPRRRTGDVLGTDDVTAASRTPPKGFPGAAWVPGSCQRELRQHRAAQSLSGEGANDAHVYCQDKGRDVGRQGGYLTGSHSKNRINSGVSLFTHFYY